jgi:hypothetical protein
MKKRTLALVAGILALTLGGCGGGGGVSTSGQAKTTSSSFNAITLDDVTQHLKEGGFTVCATKEGTSDVFGAYAQPSWYVMLNGVACPTPDTSVSHAPGDEYLDYFDIVDGTVSGEAFNSAKVRDAAVAQHPRVGPQSGLLAYTYGPFLLGADSTAKPNFLDALTKFMDKLPGAKLAYDNR